MSDRIFRKIVKTCNDCPNKMFGNICKAVLDERYPPEWEVRKQIDDPVTVPDWCPLEKLS